MFVLTLSCLTVILCKDVLVLLLGEAYKDGAIYVPILAVDSIVFMISEIMGTGINLAKKSYLNIITSIIYFMSSIISAYLLIKYFGVSFAATSRLIGSIAYLLARTYYSNKYFRIEYNYNKICFLLVLVIIYAYINTFLQNGVLYIILYIVFVSISCFVYKKELLSIINSVIDYIKRLKM